MDQWHVKVSPERNVNFYIPVQAKKKSAPVALKAPLRAGHKGGTRTTSTVGPLEGTILVGTKLTPLGQEGDGTA